MFGSLAYKLGALAIVLALIGGLFWWGVRQNERATLAESRLETATANAEIAKAINQQDSKAAATRAAADLALASGRIRVKEVLRYAKDDSTCDIPADVVRVLDDRLHGSSVPGSTTNAGSTRTDSQTPSMGISQSQSLAALDDVGEQFNLCRNQIIQQNSQIRARFPVEQ